MPKRLYKKVISVFCLFVLLLCGCVRKTYKNTSFRVILHCDVPDTYIIESVTGGMGWLENGQAVIKETGGFSTNDELYSSKTAMLEFHSDALEANNKTGSDIYVRFTVKPANKIFSLNIPAEEIWGNELEFTLSLNNNGQLFVKHAAINKPVQIQEE